MESVLKGGMFMGVVLLVSGWVLVLVAAFKVSPTWGGLSLLIPIVFVAFIVMHFRKAAQALAVMVIGLVVMFGSAALLDVYYPNVKTRTGHYRERSVLHWTGTTSGRLGMANLS